MDAYICFTFHAWITLLEKWRNRKTGRVWIFLFFFSFAFATWISIWKNGVTERAKIRHAKGTRRCGILYSFRVAKRFDVSRRRIALVPFFFFFISQIFIKLHNCPSTHNRENSSLSQVFTICAHLNSRPCGRLKGIKKKERERERSWKSGQRASLVRYIRVNLNYASANLYRSLIVAKYLFHYPSWSEMKRDMTTRKKKKSQFIRGKMARSRYSRILLFRALRVFIVIPINKIAVYIFHSRWMIKKKKGSLLDRG